MARKNRQEFLNLLNDTSGIFPDNTTGEIGADDVRSALTDFLDSGPLIHKTNRAPTASDDSPEWAQMDLWMDTSTDRIYINKDVSTNSAVWTLITGLDDGSINDSNYFVDGIIPNAKVRQGTLEADRFASNNNPSDNQVPSYNANTGGFTWVDAASGQKGTKGDQGIKGQKGAPGTGNGGGSGEKGEQGQKGQKGERGLQGNQGPQGNTGPTGPQGNPGPAGSQGEKGNTGPQGNQGPQGNPGPAGSQGIKGQKGDTGADSTVPGPQGEKGEPGVKGEPGTGEGGGTGTFDPVELFNGDVSLTTGQRYVAIDFTGTDEWDDFDAIQIQGALRSDALLSGILWKSDLERLATKLAGTTWYTGDTVANPAATFLVDQGGQGLAVGVTTDRGQLLLANSVNDAVGLTPYLVEGLKFGSGQKGSTGPQGIQGPAGSQGEKGNTGPQGPTGPASTVPGPTGPQGQKGEQGNTGPTGPASTVPGPTGPAGSQGEKGEPGADSTVPGPQGIQGPAGSQGEKGDQGEDGPAGENARTTISSTAPTNPNNGEFWVDDDTFTLRAYSNSASSWIGIAGDRGPPGSQGPQGPTGPASTVAGPKGSKGDVGPQGPISDSGNVEMEQVGTTVLIPSVGSVNGPDIADLTDTVFFDIKYDKGAGNTNFNMPHLVLKTQLESATTSNRYMVLLQGSGPADVQVWNNNGVLTFGNLSTVGSDISNLSFTVYNVKGQAGAKGEPSTVPGPAGPAGSQGEKGDQGVKGVKGNTGQGGGLTVVTTRPSNPSEGDQIIYDPTSETLATGWHGPYVVPSTTTINGVSIVNNIIYVFSQYSIDRFDITKNEFINALPLFITGGSTLSTAAASTVNNTLYAFRSSGANQIHSINSTTGEATPQSSFGSFTNSITTVNGARYGALGLALTSTHTYVLGLNSATNLRIFDYNRTTAEYGNTDSFSLPSGFTSTNIGSLTVGSSNTLWIGSSAGIAVYNLDTGAVTSGVSPYTTNWPPGYNNSARIFYNSTDNILAYANVGRQLYFYVGNNKTINPPPKYQVYLGSNWHSVNFEDII